MASPTSSQDRLRDASQALIQTLTSRTIGAADKKVTGLTSRMESMAKDGGLHLGQLPGAGGVLKGAIGGGASAMMSSVGKAVKEKGASVAHTITDKLPGGSDSDSAESGDSGGGGGSASGGSSTKVTTIIEEIDVGVPIALAYDQWTEFGSFPSFMKKVEKVNAVEDQRLKWKAQILWSHREWESTILEQKPEDRIVWKSEGKKGYVDGAVTFHELADNLTRIIVVLEYHPQGLFEHTANLWRAQARRVRVEMQHFRRHVMAHAVLDPDGVQGWRGTIEDAEVVESDEEAQQAQEDEQDQQDSAESDEQDQDSAEDSADEDEPEDSAEEDEPEDSAEEDEPEDSAEDDEPEDSAEDEEPEDSAEDEEPDEDEQDEDEEDEEDEQAGVRDEYADDDTTDEVDDEYDDEDDEDDEDEEEADEDEEDRR